MLHFYERINDDDENAVVAVRGGTGDTAVEFGGRAGVAAATGTASTRHRPESSSTQR